MRIPYIVLVKDNTCKEKVKGFFFKRGFVWPKRPFTF